MLRIASLTALAAVVLLALGANHWSGSPNYLERPFPYNSTVAHYFLNNSPATTGLFKAFRVPEADSVRGLRVLLLNYTAYDSQYVAKVRHLILQRLPGALISNFDSGATTDLKASLVNHQIVVVTYPTAVGKSNLVADYGKLLTEFVRKGGSVLFSGTDQFSVLQQYGLFDLDFGYFCSDLAVNSSDVGHPMLQDVPKSFSLKNYVYPLDISDPAFISLADVQGYPAIGFKPLGAGKVVYLGLEYYYDEAVSSRILENTLRWLAPVPSPSPQASSAPQVNPSAAASESWSSRTAVRRSEEVLYTGSAPASKSTAIDLKLYPNPYFDKATLDIELPRLSVVSVDLTDETGVLVVSPFKQQIVSAGPLRIDIPPVEAGVYFLKCQIDGKNYVRKLVKVASR